MITLVMAAALQLATSTNPSPLCSSSTNCPQAQATPDTPEQIEARKAEQLRIDAIVFAPLAGGTSSAACAAAKARADSERQPTLAAAISGLCALQNNQ